MYKKITRYELLESDGIIHRIFLKNQKGKKIYQAFTINRNFETCIAYTGQFLFCTLAGVFPQVNYMATFEEKVDKQVKVIRQHTFLDPTYDWAFKEIFSKDVTLIHFLNAILRLPKNRQIKSIERKEPAATLTSEIDSKEVRFDVHAKLNDDSYLDLEMQRAWHEDFIDRVALYADQLSIESKIHFDSQRTEAEKEDHPYEMPRTYCVWICNFKVDFCKNYHEELSLFRFASVGQVGAKPVYDKKRYIIVDLTRVNAMALNLNTAEAEWLKVFTTMAKASEAPKTKDSVIADVYNRMRVKALGTGFIKEIATGMVTEAEISTRIGTARRQGEAAGLKKAAVTIANLRAASKDKDAKIAAMEAENASQAAYIKKLEAQVAAKQN